MKRTRRDVDVGGRVEGLNVGKLYVYTIRIRLGRAGVSFLELIESPCQLGRFRVTGVKSELDTMASEGRNGRKLKVIELKRVLSLVCMQLRGQKSSNDNPHKSSNHNWPSSFFSTMLSRLLSSVDRHLVRCKQFALDRCTVLLGEQGQQRVADFEFFDDGAET